MLRHLWTYVCGKALRDLYLVEYMSWYIRKYTWKPTFVEECLEFTLVLREDGLSRTLRVGRSGGYSSVGVSYFSFLQDNEAGSGTHPSSSGYRGSFPGIEQPGCDVHTL